MRRIAAGLLIVAVAPLGFAQDLKDPTRPPLAAVPTPTHHTVAAPTPRVTAILVSAERRVATFDGQPVHVGDRVGACLIEEITGAGVRYRSQGKSLFAALEKAAP
jgi:hypothetical protein